MIRKSIVLVLTVTSRGLLQVSPAFAVVVLVLAAFGLHRSHATLVNSARRSFQCSEKVYWDHEVEKGDEEVVENVLEAGDDLYSLSATSPLLASTIFGVFHTVNKMEWLCVE